MVEDTSKCPACGSSYVVKWGTAKLKSGDRIQSYRCKDCGKRLRYPGQKLPPRKQQIDLETFEYQDKPIPSPARQLCR